MPFPLRDFVQSIHIPNATDATNQLAFTAPFDLEIVSVQARHRVASTSGTMDVVKANSGQAVSAGTSLLTGTMSNAGAADTNVTGALSTAIGGRSVLKGQSVGLLFAGTLTNLVDLDITIVARQTKKN